MGSIVWWVVSFSVFRTDTANHQAVSAVCQPGNSCRRSWRNSRWVAG